MHARDVTHEPSWLSPANTGQLPFEFWTLKRNCMARSWALWNSGPRAMHARVVGSRAGCDDDDRAAHPPLGNCFSANCTRRPWISTSLVVTMALLYCRAPILSNCARRTLVDSSTGCAYSAERGAQWCSPPKVRMAEISWSRLRKCEDGQLAGAATTQDAYGREIFRLHAPTRKVRSGREVSPPTLHTAKYFLTVDPVA